MSATKGKKREIESDAVAMGFQIAPMIDVVFVIMLFFMVMAGAVKVEMVLNTTLPGVATTSADDVVLPDEIIILISEDGTVTMNEEEFDTDHAAGTPAYKKLPGLTANLMRLKKDADDRGSKVLVTLQTEEQARYERIIDVMNALSKAQISNVTFTVGTEE
jgi:biopolymer transport protein ExbD